MNSQQTPRVRRAPLPAGAVLIVRGDALDESVLLQDAARFVRRFPDWRKAGVSAYYARDGLEIDALCATKLTQFSEVMVFRRSDLENSGIEVVGTFRTPHVTLAAVDTDRLVECLLACPHRTVRNPYYESEPSEEAR